MGLVFATVRDSSDVEPALPPAPLVYLPAGDALSAWALDVNGELVQAYVWTNGFGGEWSAVNWTDWGRLLNGGEVTPVSSFSGRGLMGRPPCGHV